MQTDWDDLLILHFHELENTNQSLYSDEACPKKNILNLIDLNEDLNYSLDFIKKELQNYSIISSNFLVTSFIYLILVNQLKSIRLIPKK